jgi:hypothetical protein
MIPLTIICAVLALVWLANHGVGLIMAVVVLGYLGDCTVRPRIACQMCKGVGSVMRRGRVFAQCPLCKGRKHHTRIGARIWRRHRYMFRDPDDTGEWGPTLHDRGWW